MRGSVTRKNHVNTSNSVVKHRGQTFNCFKIMFVYVKALGTNDYVDETECHMKELHLYH